MNQEHPARWFKCYGMLDWLEPEDFYSGPWVLSEQTAIDQYGLRFSIVFDEANFDYRYTVL